jgi:hypothetical protein
MRVARAYTARCRREKLFVLTRSDLAGAAGKAGAVAIQLGASAWMA